MKRTTITVIMGMTALAVLILAASVSADQTGAAPVPARDTSFGSLAPGLGSLANVQLVRHGGGGGRFHGGFGGYGPYYGGYPYGGYSSSDVTTSSAPTCLWNGYKYTCYDSSGRIMEE